MNEMFGNVWYPKIIVLNLCMPLITGFISRQVWYLCSVRSMFWDALNSCLFVSYCGRLFEGCCW